ncbi:MAG TPA: aldehyde dehydrogenase family protein [Candidatus Lustribacter sp.]|nr:aldehyde dehydrogenase family protein [Candidatus Lustribacter sp.]
MPAADVSYDPRTGSPGGAEPWTSPEAGSAAVHAAAAAADAVASTDPRLRQQWLGRVAAAIEADAQSLAALADEETGLGLPRLEGEARRAAAQARFYAQVGAEGSWLGAALDTVPGPPVVDLRRVNRPVGPVAVFGASNFPFGFGLAGHDTMSAIAAGCPVVAKAHPAHPRLGAALAAVVSGALAQAGAPDGTFALVRGFDAGLALVDAPEIAAVAFTGSQAGGMALAARAAARPRPVPVYAEMGTVNPVVVTPAGAAARGDEIAQGFVASFTLGAGQFCTKPGLILVPAGSGLAAAVAAAVTGAATAPLLTEAIATNARLGVERLVGAGGRVLAVAPGTTVGYGVAPVVLAAALDDLVPGSPLLEECFGPVALVIEYAGLDQLLGSARRLQPCLAAAIASRGPGDPAVPDLVAVLAKLAGRVIVDGWPTGVATTWAQHHGGPWPSTSRPDATSVGAAALARFVRPTAYQDVPEAALPEPIRRDNPWGVPQRVDGVLR